MSRARFTRRRPARAAALAAVLLAVSAAGAATGPVRRFPQAAVAAVEPLAAEVGAAILTRGGTAADAAVAAALALAVVHPRAGNLAGGHFSLWRGADGSVEVIDGREAAPAAATAQMFMDPARGAPIPDASVASPLAIAVPGTLPALGLLHARHGRLPWPDVVEPARRLAADGFAVSALLAADLHRARHTLLRDPDAAAAYLPGGVPPQAGQRLRLPDLAWSLGQVQEHGPGALGEGPLARRLATDLKRRRAVLTGADLAAYQPVLRRPLGATYRGYRAWTPPLPSAGGVTLAQTLHALRSFTIGPADRGGARLAHLQAELLRRAFADRHQAYGQDPLGVLLAPERLLAWSRALRLEQAAPSAPLFGGESSRPPAAGLQTSETTHLSVIDADGNAVAHTTTLNGRFGVGQVARGTGILWNNGMDDFAVAPGAPNLYGIPASPHNAVAPGRRPLSSMAPTIVDRDGRLAFVLGSPGGATIPSTLLQVLVALVDLRMGPREAVESPRIHHQGIPDRLTYEPGALSPETLAGLARRGHRLRPAARLQGDVHLLVAAPDGSILAAPDPRRGGAAAGL